MADYNDLMKLEKKPKQAPPAPTSLPTPLLSKQEARIPVNPQVGKQTNPHTSLHANPQAGKPASMQGTETKPLPVEKFSTYMRADYKKRLKQIALDRDCDTYEVLEDAVALLFESLDAKK